MQAFDINAFDINKNYVIEASAGTGKTYNVIEILKKLLKSGKYMLNDILIVTYTEKACGELKRRISKILDEYNFSSNIEDANIYTIHSFCQNTIKEFGLSANLSLNLEMETIEIENFVHRYIRSSKVLNEILFIKEYDDNFKESTFEKDLINGAKKYYLNNDFEEDKSIVSIESDCLNKFGGIIKLKHTIKSHKELYDVVPNLRVMLQALDDFYSKNSVKKAFISDMDASLEKSGEFFKFHRGSYKADKLTPVLLEYYKNIIKLHDIFNQSSYELMFYKYMKDFYKEYLNYKINNRLESFDDMIRYVREAVLNNDIFRHKLKEKYKYAIIDEFQDTNQKQFDIFKSIFLNDTEHHIVVVGDPKQSIYSFQGADINVYNKAKEEISKIGEIRNLDTNYRSTNEMVESCNEIFKEYGFNEFIGSKTSNNFETKYNGNDTEAVLIAEGQNESPIKDYEFAKVVCEQILDLTKMENGKTKLQVGKKEEGLRNISFSDFTVLARTRKELKPIKMMLKKAGIPYLQYKNGDLFSGRENAHLISLLEAISQTDFTGINRKYLYKAFASMFFGYSLGDLKNDYFTHDDIDEVQLIYSWQELLKDNQYEKLFDSIINDSYLTNNLNDSESIESMSIFRQLAFYAIDFLANAHSFDDLIINLKSLSTGLSDDEEGSIVEKASDADAVQLMTMHASKGLQFPIVICVGGYSSISNSSKCFISHDISSNNSFCNKLVYKKTDDVKDAEKEEFKRLFYVAYTRAINLLILPNACNNYFKFITLPINKFREQNVDKYRLISTNKMSYQKMLELSKEVISRNAFIVNKEKEMNEREIQETNIKSLIQKEVFKSLYKHSYTSLSHPHIIEDEDDKEGSENDVIGIYDRNAIQIEQTYVDCEPVNFNTFPKGAKMGTVLHEIFEVIDFTNYMHDLDYTIRNIFTKYSIDLNDEWIALTKSIVINTINAKINLIKGSNKISETISLSDITFNNRKSEAEFNFNLDKTLRNYGNGFIDLIFKRGEYFSIVDWKSDGLNDTFESYSKKEDLKAQVDDRYSIQRVLYSYCLIKWLKMFYEKESYEEIFNNHFGGIYYIFIKGTKENTGNGIYSQTWTSFSDLECAYNEIINDKIGGNNE